ncbi:hypothetical protein ACLQ2R_03110 [Streptosporangium sp. DT93]|uniref:hypothetical protein n=1 Tax=Streptosporangium sp. DT93 TaxID=3393428 RepID=UPI003CF45D99
MIIATVLLWVALMLGIGPMLWFSAQFRPSRPRAWPIPEERWPAWIIWVLVSALLLSYLRIAVVLVLRTGGISQAHGWVDAAASVLPLFVIDAAIIPLLLLARKYRAYWAAYRQTPDDKELP